MTQVIWVVINTTPRTEYIGPLVEERIRIGVDMMYPRRFTLARKLLPGDRVVMHFGGPSQSHPKAQHLVAAGCVRETARPLTATDADCFRRLWCLTRDAYEHWPRSPEDISGQGIIFYELYRCETQGVRPLPRPFAPPKLGANFIPLDPNNPIYKCIHDKVDKWWHQVVPPGRCAV